MRRAVIVVTIAGIAASGAGTATAGSNNLDIPQVNRISLIERHGVPDQVVARGTIAGKTAHRIVRRLNHLTPYPKHVMFACKANRGDLRTAIIRSDAHTWRVEVGSCGSVPFVTTDGGKARAYHATKRFTAAFNRGFVLMRPRAEHVPATVHTVRLAHRASPAKPWTHRRTVSGKRAHALVKAFNHLKVEPPHYIHCQAAGGPEDRVVFAAAKHSWVATQAPCTNLQVRRDGKTLPALLTPKRWTRAVQAGLSA
jgi:hypothetical protein